jgi:hypothetical protein
MTLAIQHSEVWEGTCLISLNSKARKYGDVNFVVGFSGELITIPKL